MKRKQEWEKEGLALKCRIVGRGFEEYDEMMRRDSPPTCKMNFLQGQTQNLEECENRDA